MAWIASVLEHEIIVSLYRDWFVSGADIPHIYIPCLHSIWMMTQQRNCHSGCFFFAMKNWRQSILRRNRINRMEWIVCLWVTAVGAHTPCFHWWKLMELSALNWIRFMPKRSHNIFLSYALRLATNIINISRLFMIIRLSADAQPHWLDSAILLAVIYIDCHSKVNAEAPSMAYFRPAIVWIYKADSYRFFFVDDAPTMTMWRQRCNVMDGGVGRIFISPQPHIDIKTCPVVAVSSVSEFWTPAIDINLIEYIAYLSILIGSITAHLYRCCRWSLNAKVTLAFNGFPFPRLFIYERLEKFYFKWLETASARGR